MILLYILTILVVLVYCWIGWEIKQERKLKRKFNEAEFKSINYEKELDKIFDYDSIRIVPLEGSIDEKEDKILDKGEEEANI